MSGAPSTYETLAKRYGARYGVPPALLLGQEDVESGFRAKAVSKTGDYGPAQINLASHPGVTATQAETPAFAVAFEAKYLRSLFDRCGSWEGALTEYNHGTALGCAPSAYSTSVLGAAKSYGYAGDAGASASPSSSPSSSPAAAAPFPTWAWFALLGVAALLLILLL